jgi:hypothetical protein
MNCLGSSARLHDADPPLGIGGTAGLAFRDEALRSASQRELLVRQEAPLTLRHGVLS